MTEKGYMSDIYKQLEEVMNKCDSLSQQIKTVKRNVTLELNTRFDIERTNYENRIKDLKNEVDGLKKENLTLKEDNTLLKNEVDRLKSQLNKNSDNSSKPPCSDTKKKVHNNREKSKKTSGGQHGHKGNYLSKESIEEKIKNKEVQHEIVNHGKASDKLKYISKYEVTAKLVVIVKEHRFYPNEKGKYNIDKKYKNDVFYGDELKAICSFLSVETSMPVNKVVSTIATLSGNVLKLSEGTIINFLNELSNKSKVILENMKNILLNSKEMYTDETGTKCNGQRRSVRNYSTKNTVVYKANRQKNKKSIEENCILNNYTGDIIHDHETVIYNYGNRHVECNVHICRYLKGNTENTNNLWSIQMRELLIRLNNSRKMAILYGQNFFEKDDVSKYELEYDEILEKGFIENQKTSSKFHRQEEKKLLNRLKKYKENHLLFIHDFSLPFDNNLSERDIRVYKTKTKVSGGFRSNNGLNVFTNILSIVKTARKRALDVFKVLVSIYKGTTAVFS